MLALPGGRTSTRARSSACLRWRICRMTSCRTRASFRRAAVVAGATAAACRSRGRARRRRSVSVRRLRQRPPGCRNHPPGPPSAWPPKPAARLDARALPSRAPHPPRVTPPSATGPWPGRPHLLEPLFLRAPKRLCAWSTSQPRPSPCPPTSEPLLASGPLTPEGHLPADTALWLTSRAELTATS